MEPILFLLPDLDAGGSQRTLVNLANTLSQQVPCVLASVRKPGDGAIWLNPETPFRTLGADHTRDGLFAYMKLVRELRPEVVLSSGIDANILTWIGSYGLTPGSRPRRFVRETNSHRVRQDIGFLRRSLIGPSYRSAAGVIALSHGVGTELAEDYGLAPQTISVIGNPVDVQGIGQCAEQARKNPAPWHDRWGPEARVVISVGRLHKQKGFDRLLRAFAQSKQQNLNLRLVILGEGPDRLSLESEAAVLGLDDSILLHGYCEDVVPWYAHADLFVLLSRWEGFGHVIVEAMASGLCAIVTDCPHGPRDIISTGENGLLLKQAPDQSICDEAAASISRLMSQPSLRVRLAEAGMRHAMTYDQSKISLVYLDAMQRHAEKRRHTAWL